MKLKEIPQNTVVHTPTEAEAKELLAILHENGYKWYCSGKEEGWENFGDETCYRINSKAKVYHTCDREWYETICPHCILPVLTLANFKRMYCEEEKPQPKFKVGDKVVVVTNAYGLKKAVGGVCEITNVLPHGYYMESPTGEWFAKESELEPYTEPETKPTEDVETKVKESGEKGNSFENSQLNLCELLKGHEGETFYSTISGDVKITDFCDGVMKPIGTISGRYCSDGKYQSGGVVCLYPSRALYEQYPLDPYTAWMKWLEEQKKHWLSVTAWIDDIECESDTAIDTNKIYFRTPADRDKCIEVIDAFLSQIQKSKSVASLCEEIKAIIEKYSKK